MQSSTGKARLSEEQFPTLLVVLATMLGLAVRLSLPLTASFPLNDGGLFAAMISDLRASDYLLPAFTSYNNAAIPFAYPPLALYVTGLLSELLRLPVLGLMRVLPALVSAAAVPAFYLLARDLLPDRGTAALGALLFALTPRVFEWHIMGGGITRAFGFLFAILTLVHARRMLDGNGPRDLLRTAFWGSCTALTHPEAAVQVMLGALMILISSGRSRERLTLAAAAAALAAALAAPWWLTVLKYHGPGPFVAAFLSAGQDSASLWTRIFSAFAFEFTSEPYLPLVALLALIGAFRASRRQEFLLVAWMMVAFLVEPRGGTLFMMIPLTMLAGQGLESILASFRATASEVERFEGLFMGGRAKRFFLFLLIYLLLASYVSPSRILRHATLTAPDLEAMNWIKSNTPPDANFLLITGGQPLLDPVSDWFPSISERTSVATVFGREWVNDGRFGARIRDYVAVQACAAQGVACVQEWARDTQLTFDYVLVTRSMVNESSIPPLAFSLALSDSFERAYEGAGVVVFRRNNPSP
jgi:uncharacterized membrane protein